MIGRSRVPDEGDLVFLGATEGILTRVEDRWAGYWVRNSSILKRLQNQGHDSLKARRIRSAVYGDIQLDKISSVLVDLPEVQRLRRISQTGLVHLVYPEARHSRFDHSLGVFWNVQRMLTTLKDSLTVGEDEEHNLLAAALLHDIGHGPFSHCTEMWQESLGSDDGTWCQHRPQHHQYDCLPHEVKIQKGNTKMHEANGARLLFDHPVALEMTARGLSRLHINPLSASCGKASLNIGPILKELGISCERVAQYIIGDPSGGDLTPLINGPMDADKLDYYQRDTFFTGTPAAGADVEYITHEIQRAVTPDQGRRICWPTKAANDLFFNLISRDYLYASTAFHPVCQSANAMLATGFFEAYRALQDASANAKKGSPDSLVAGRFLLYLPFMEDEDIWAFLHLAGSCVSRDSYRRDCCRTAAEITRRLESRDLFRRQCTMHGDQRSAFNVRVEETLQRTAPQLANPPAPFLYLVDHRSNKGNRCVPGDIILIDWGWAPSAHKTLADTRRKCCKLLQARPKAPCNSVWIHSGSGTTSVFESLETCLGDTDKHELAKGLARYKYALSYVQILNSDGHEVGDMQDNPDLVTSEICDRLGVEALLSLPARTLDSSVKSTRRTQSAAIATTGTQTHNANDGATSRIGPRRANEGALLSALDDLVVHH